MSNRIKVTILLLLVSLCFSLGLQVRTCFGLSRRVAPSTGYLMRFKQSIHAESPNVPQFVVQASSTNQSRLRTISSLQWQFMGPYAVIPIMKVMRKALSSAVGYLLGDAVAQIMSRKVCCVYSYST